MKATKNVKLKDICAGLANIVDSAVTSLLVSAPLYDTQDIVVTVLPLRLFMVSVKEFYFPGK